MTGINCFQQGSVIMQIGTFNSVSAVNTSENVSRAVKKDNTVISQNSIAELKDKQANDIKSNDSFSDAYAIDISDAGYAAYEKNAARVSSADGTNGTITILPDEIPEQNEKPSAMKKPELKHAKWSYGVYGGNGFDYGKTKNMVMGEICSSIKGLLSISSTMNFNINSNAYAESVFNADNLANSLNFYAEVYGQDDAFFDGLLDAVNELADKSDNVILHKIRSMVVDVKNGKYINLNDDKFTNDFIDIIRSAVSENSSEPETRLTAYKGKKYYSTDFNQTQSIQQNLDNMELKQEEDIVDKMLGTDTENSNADNDDNSDIASLIAKPQEKDSAADDDFINSVRHLDRQNNNKKTKEKKEPLHIVHSLSQEWSEQIEKLTKQYQFEFNDMSTSPWI